MEIKDIKVGMVVICTDASGSSVMVENKAYEVERVSPNSVYLKGKHGGVWPWRFAPAPIVEMAAPVGQAGGLKYDGGKAPWSLLLSAKGMIAAVGGVVGVLAFGAKKYAAHSWREVEDNERRYTDALIRHLVAIQTHGLTARDEESGELHIDHLNCNGLFLGELARK